MPIEHCHRSFTLFERQELQKRLDSPQQTPESQRHLTALLATDAVPQLHITCSAAAWLDGGQSNAWDRWLLEVHDNQVLLLSTLYFASPCDPPHLPAPEFFLNRELVTFFSIFADECPLAPLVPRAFLLYQEPGPAFSSDETIDVTAVPRRFLPDTPQGRALELLEDGDLFCVALDAVLENPLILLEKHVGNLLTPEHPDLVRR